jgi:hypothetical protein
MSRCPNAVDFFGLVFYKKVYIRTRAAENLDPNAVISICIYKLRQILKNNTDNDVVVCQQVIQRRRSTYSFVHQKL